MPMPASFTRTTASSPSRPSVIEIGWPASLYFALLLSRLANTCASRVRSPFTNTGRAGGVTVDARGPAEQRLAGFDRRR